MAFSLMYSLNARSFKERYQNSVQQNIIKDNERHLLKIFDTLSLQRSLKKKCVSPSNDATGDGGRCEAEAGEDIIVDQRKSYEVEIHTNLKRKTPSISWDCSGRWKGSGSTQSGGLRSVGSLVEGDGRSVESQRLIIVMMTQRRQLKSCLGERLSSVTRTKTTEKV